MGLALLGMLVLLKTLALRGAVMPWPLLGLLTAAIGAVCKAQGPIS
jgi:hypothetical protein